jgi:hypothetical protein
MFVHYACALIHLGVVLLWNDFFPIVFGITILPTGASEAK